jgi:ankyrin repeat protein
VDRALIEAARAAKLDEVTLLLKRGANPNVSVAPDGLTMTPVIAAVGSQTRTADRVEIIRLLLISGAEANFRNERGRTALSIAAFLVDPDAIRLLLEHGADPNLNDKQNISPLTYSLFGIGDEARHLEVMRMLLSKGADPNVKPWVGETALYRAVQQRSANMVKLLFDHGADHNLKDRSGKTPLMAAVEGSYLHDKTLEMVQLLVKAGADPNAADNDGKTVAVVAASTGNMEILPLLARLGSRDASELAKKGDFDATAALIQALRSANIGKAKLLIAGGANVKFSDANGWTLLHVVANSNSNGMADLVPLMIANGADVSAKTRHGSTPLLVAVQKRNTEVVKRLLQARANPNVKDKDGVTPLILAAKYEHIVQIHYGPSVRMIRNLEPEIAKLLLDAGAAPNEKDPDGLTALMFAAAQGRLELVKTLLAGGADVNAKGADGVTASQVAVGDDVIEALNQARKKSGTAKPK